MARSLVVVVAAAVEPLDAIVAVAVGRSPVEVGSFAEEAEFALDWIDAAAAVGAAVAAAKVVDPDLLLPVVDRERKNTTPDVASRGMLLAISVSRWWHDPWGEAIRSVDAVEVGQVLTVLAGSAVVAGNQDPRGSRWRLDPVGHHTSPGWGCWF